MRAVPYGAPLPSDRKNERWVREPIVEEESSHPLPLRMPALLTQQVPS